MKYELELTGTEASAGYFEAVPVESMMLNDLFDYVQDHPHDEFMHRHMLKIISTFDSGRVDKLIHDSKNTNPVLSALLYEACGIHDKFNSLLALFEQNEIKELSTATPLVYIKSSLMPDQALHSRWTRVFRSNIEWHHPLSAPDKTALPPLYDKSQIAAARSKTTHINHIAPQLNQKKLDVGMVPPHPKKTARCALNALEQIAVFADEEKQHMASLSPCALLRQWHFNHTVHHGRHNYTLSGIQTSYGKGLTMDTAKASLYMEIVERCSSFAGFSPDGATGYTKKYPLLHATYDDAIQTNIAVLNPNHLALEIEYANESLYWLEGEIKTNDKTRPILIPAQCVFLFCNLDEPNLFSGLGSTGLASGNSLAEAKVSAILEVIERDIEGTSFYNPDRCFKLESHDSEIAVLLEDYKAADIHFYIQELTSPMGIPCYKCFAVTRQGQIIKGTSAHLDGKKAVLSALTETPYPYPFGSPSRSVIDGLQDRWLEELPDYSSGCPEMDLDCLETLLSANHYHPIYVDLTRKDLAIPVVKAIIPGMEWLNNFDNLSRVSLRLYGNYLDWFQ